MAADGAVAASVLLIVRAGEPEAARPELAGLLGRERCLAVERLLVARAKAWAAEVAPGRVHVEPALKRAPVAPVASLAGAGDGGWLGAAVDRVLGGSPGPLLVVWPELPRWRPEHGAAALDDLRSGCDVTVGPVFDGGFYLLGVAAPVPELFALPGHAWRGPEAMGQALGAAHRAGLTAGLLRAERGLHGAADVRAALADPLLDDELRGLLDPAG